MIDCIIANYYTSLEKECIMKSKERGGFAMTVHHEDIQDVARGVYFE